MLLLCAATLLGGCGRITGVTEPVDGPGDRRDLSRVPDAVPRAEPLSRGGNAPSYVVFGKRYHTIPTSAGFTERGVASWYGSKFHGRKTANGETYDMYAMTAAHRQLPLPSYVEVTNLENGKRVTVRVNDRGPFHDNRIIDLSYAAASRIGMLAKGTALVEVRALDPGQPRKAAVDTPPAGAAPRIYLQAAAFTNSDNARRLRDRLAGAGLASEVRIQTASTSAGRVYRVQLGPLASVEIADDLDRRLRDFGIVDPHLILE